jgi:tRNA A37 threonylcarbamoyladenosine dehydratase
MHDCTDLAGAEAAAELERRFGGVARLYGAAALHRFAAARVAVVGLGGVGSWAAEALARSAVARITLIDLDHISPSNTNRQLHALSGDFGMAKVQAMALRLGAIHPQAQVHAIEDFVTPQNAAQLLAGVDLVIDCIDQPSAKAAMVAHARSLGLPIVVCGGAGGRRDPLRIRCGDLARTEGDALLASVRQRLRKDYGFAGRGRAKHAPRFGVTAVYSDEPLQRAPVCAPDEAAPGSPLACGGYGSAVTVTAAMGLAAAACALDHLAGTGVPADLMGVNAAAGAAD